MAKKKNYKTTTSGRAKASALKYRNAKKKAASEAVSGMKGGKAGMQENIPPENN
jgi:hypothetical protein